MMNAIIKAIEYAVPEYILTNEQLAREYPGWSIEKIEDKTGIRQRFIAASDESASDLGIIAAQKLFSSGTCRCDEIDYIILCTQSPDYILPTTACIMQDLLGIPKSAGALDFNLGCSGFVYGLGLAKGLIETEQAKNVLFITADTYSKYIHPGDKSVRTLFGDGAAATLIQDGRGSAAAIGPFIYGTDGSGYKNLIVPNGGIRTRGRKTSSDVSEDVSGNTRSDDNLFMNGSEIFSFALLAVPKAISGLLEKSNQELDSIDLFVFHQANKFMLESLRRRCNIPKDKYFLAYEKFGNTVSSSIPIALREAELEGRLRPGMKVALVGFGVGYSWGATLIVWQGGSE